ncbi:MAG TPA: hypothetical protein VE861_01660 [Gemmatimonadaceae bacterium]|nr:hypothetical protein [Gemmatimonadaceae bacterium]
MSISSLTSGLPSTLPDLFRRTEGAPARGDDAGASGNATDAANPDDQRALAARSNTTEDTTRLLARRAALGPLTYGRRAVPANAPAAAPIGMRGALLDVRG